MITYNGNILTTSTGKWYIPNRPYSISYSTVPNGTFSGPSQAYGGQLVTVTSTGSSSNYVKDYITVNGVQIVGNTFIMPYGDVVISGAFKINYNPLNLPPYTIRFEAPSYFTPSHPDYKFDSYTVVAITQEGHRIVDFVYNNTDWSSMFSAPAYSKDIIKVLGANTAGVTNMYRMFYQQKGLTEVPLFDTSSVTNMSGMFKDCQQLRTVPLFDTHNVTDMSRMFDISASTSYGYGLTSCPNFNTSNVTNMEGMFDRCSQLVTAPVFNTSKVNNFSYMFIDCIKLRAVPMYTLHQSSSAINLGAMYYNCTSVTSGAYEFYNYAKNFNTSHSNTFYNCGASNKIPSDWK